jgi:hypothetical protein
MEVRPAHPHSLGADQHLVRGGFGDDDLLDLERRLRFVEYGGFHFIPSRLS